jgi:hypothetical protein
MNPTELAPLAGIASLGVALLAFARAGRRENTADMEKSVAKELRAVMAELKNEWLDRLDTKLDRYALREYVDHAVDKLRAELRNPGNG